ncbi:MAG: CotH kinase family protein, partial [Phaeodactylibacter sp.]|nr:CotH kinase family protein [Phaeodactylibacter sp.]
MKKTALFILSFLLFTPLWAQKKSAEPSGEPLPVELNFSLEGGFYPDEVVAELSAPGAAVYYTVDGSTPSPTSPRYKRPLRFEQTTVLRAVAYHADGRKSPVIGHTYFIREPRSNFAVLSIGISPGVLFHPRSGLFMLGNNVVDTLWKKPGANFWSRSEFPASVELYETDGRCVYRSQSGFRLFGGMSRLFPQKSIALVARHRYGDTRIRHKVFGKEGLNKFKFLVLRNSGSDFGKTHFRDALMTGLVEDWDIDKQDCRPAHVYINGQYWGIYNIREKVNRYFIADNHPEVDKDSIDLIEHRFTRKRGGTRHYVNLLNFLEENSLADPANYAYVQTQMDVQNFMDYQIAQIYFDNQDAGGNIKFWRPQKPGGRWRWILYDTDWGFGLHDRKAYKNNSLAFHTRPDGPTWPNPPWSTFLLRKLLENKEFEKAFVNRFAGYLSTSFSEETVLNRIDSTYDNLLPEMPRHLDRWNLSQRKWEEEVSIVREFAQERPGYVRMHLMGHFNTGPQRRLIVSTSPGGRIIINDQVSVANDTIELVYFENYPITIRAVAHHGYQLSRWEGIDAAETVREFSLTLTKGETYLHARFDEFIHPMEGKLVINEVCPKNGKAGDWIELFNASRNRASLKGWTLADRNGNEYIFPEAYVGPNDYLVIARDSVKFTQAYPGAYNVLNGLNFGLNKRRESLALYSILGAMVDSITYEVPPVDSSFTLSLLLPYLDNSDPDNWESRFGDGSPNAANPYYVESRVRHEQA